MQDKLDALSRVLIEFQLEADDAATILSYYNKGDFEGKLHMVRHPLSGQWALNILLLDGPHGSSWDRVCIFNSREELREYAELARARRPDLLDMGDFCRQ